MSIESNVVKQITHNLHQRRDFLETFRKNSQQTYVFDEMPMNSGKVDQDAKTERDRYKNSMNLDYDYTNRQQVQKALQKDYETLQNQLNKKNQESKSQHNLDNKIDEEDSQNKSMPFINNNSVLPTKTNILQTVENKDDEQNYLFAFQQSNQYMHTDYKEQETHNNITNSCFALNNNNNAISIFSIQPSPKFLDKAQMQNDKNNQQSQPVQINSQIDIKSCQSQITCLICFDSDCNSIFAPCGHGGVCYPCALDIFKKKGDCLLCRKKVSEVYKYIEVVDENAKKNSTQRFFQIQSITKYLDVNQTMQIKKQTRQNTQNKIQTNVVYTSDEIEQQLVQYSFCELEEQQIMQFNQDEQRVCANSVNICDNLFRQQLTNQITSLRGSQQTLPQIDNNVPDSNVQNTNKIFNQFTQNFVNNNTNISQTSISQALQQVSPKFNNNNIQKPLDQKQDISLQSTRSRFCQQSTNEILQQSYSSQQNINNENAQRSTLTYLTDVLPNSQTNSQAINGQNDGQNDLQTSFNLSNNQINIDTNKSTPCHQYISENQILSFTKLNQEIQSENNKQKLNFNKKPSEQNILKEQNQQLNVEKNQQEEKIF